MSVASLFASSRLAADPPNPPRVVQVISGLFYGGGQRVVLDLLNSLSATGGAETVLCSLGKNAETQLAGSVRHTIPYDGRYNNPLTLWKAAQQLRLLVADEKYDIVHTHGVDADLIGAAALRKLPARHICHLHITPPVNQGESWKSAVRRRLFRYLTSRKRSWFIAVSEAVRVQMADYYGLPLNRILTVRNGIRLSDYCSPSATEQARGSGSVVFGTAARLAPMKGLEYLLQAAGLLREQGLTFSLRIAGSGSCRRSLETLSITLGIQDQVTFLGQVRDMSAFYRSLDVFVLPSVSTEGLPLVVLEAMANEKPVIATELAGTPEVIRNGVEGLLVPPGDAQLLAAAMAKLASDAELGHEMGTAGLERVMSEFAIDRVAREVVEVYQRVLADA